MTVFSVGSVTYANKAARLLRREGIQASVVKLDTTKSSKGCTHGIELILRDSYRAMQLLRRADIPFARYPAV